MRKKNKVQQYIKQNKPKKNYGCLLVFVILLGMLAWFFFFSKVFMIKQVSVEGLSKKDNEKIENEILKNADQKNLFSFSSSNTESSIKDQYKDIAKIKIYKSPPDLLRVVIVQRKSSLVWQSNGKKFIIDNFGVVYKKYNDSAKDLSVIIDERNEDIELGEKILTNNLLQFISGIEKNFEKGIGLEISKIVIRDSVFEILVYEKNGMYMIFDTTTNLEKQILDAKKALEIIGNKKVEYLDLRVPGKVYYK